MTTPNDDRMSLIELDLPRATTAPTVRQPIPVVAAPVQIATATTGAPGVIVPAAPASAVTVPAPIGGYCGCPIGTRPAAVRGGSGVNVCPTCRHPRGAVRVAAPAANTDSGAVAASLGVQATTARAAHEILTPRETALREIRERLRMGLGSSAADLRKWETMLASATETTSARPNGFVRHTEVVAGAKVDASGIFTGFGGQHTQTRGELLAKLAGAALPAEWAPAAKSAHAQAGRVLQGLSRGGYVVRATRVPAGRDLTARNWRARWTVGTGNASADVGAAFGTTVLVVTLTTGDQLTIEGDAGLAARVRTEFDAAIATEEYSAADVSSWIAGVLMNHFRAARIGGNWYIRKSYAADAERFLSAMSRGWGRDWLLPAIPMSTTEQLTAGLAKNFIAEAEAVLAVYAEELHEAETHGKREIGSRRATTLHAEIRQLAERASGYALMLGDRHVAELRTKLSIAANKIAESIDGITQRFELIFDELRWEASKESGSGR